MDADNTTVATYVCTYVWMSQTHRLIEHTLPLQLPTACLQPIFQICTYTCAHTRAHAHTHTHACMHAHTHACMHTHTHIHHIPPSYTCPPPHTTDRRDPLTMSPSSLLLEKATNPKAPSPICLTVSYALQYSPSPAVDTSLPAPWPCCVRGPHTGGVTSGEIWTYSKKVAEYNTQPSVQGIQTTYAYYTLGSGCYVQSVYWRRATQLQTTTVCSIHTVHIRTNYVYYVYNREWVLRTYVHTVYFRSGLCAGKLCTTVDAHWSRHIQTYRRTSKASDQCAEKLW